MGGSGFSQLEDGGYVCDPCLNASLEAQNDPNLGYVMASALERPQAEQVQLIRESLATQPAPQQNFIYANATIQEAVVVPRQLAGAVNKNEQILPPPKQQKQSAGIYGGGFAPQM